MMRGGLRMDQVKAGAFLKKLRRERGITQEQLAAELGVSGRTISRWETGSNMPDISLLVEIAEYFDVSIPEIIKGERKSEDMKEETKEVAETMSDYARAEKEQLVKSIRNMSIMGLAALFVYMVLDITGLYDRSSLLRYVYGISEALIYVTVLMFPLYTTGLLSKIRISRSNYAFKRIPMPVMKAIAFLAAFAVAALIRIMISKLFG
jgi:transcriptional regulator with XRE-family HTH domain